MFQILVWTSSFILMPTLSGTQEQFWAVTTLNLFQLQWRTGSQSWKGLDVVSHLMRWRYLILTNPAKCEITPTENISTFLGGLYMGNLHAFILWSKVWFGPRHSIHVDAVRKSSWEARLGLHYSFPASLADMFKILARPGRLVKKQWYFSPDEVEVFYLDPSP